eukprot:scaffold23893_cov25-Tisochrysis_lutea.AAC.3
MVHASIQADRANLSVADDHTLEESGWANNCVGHIGLLAQLVLKFHLGVLELQCVRILALSRLDAESGEQNEVARAGGPRGIEAVQCGLVIDGIRVLLGARAARETANHNVNCALLKRHAWLAERGLVADVGLDDLGTRKLLLRLCPFRVAHHRHRRVAARDRLAHDRLADVAGRSDDHHILPSARLPRHKFHGGKGDASPTLRGAQAARNPRAAYR